MLYERHLVAAKRAAACLANTPAEREDLVAEAFTRVLRMLREGRGPDEDFRPYLLVTLRNTAINATTRGAPVSLYADVPDVRRPTAADDPVIDRWHATVAADAFASLPERWRVVLWHTEVENESPGDRGAAARHAAEQRRGAGLPRARGPAAGVPADARARGRRASSAGRRSTSWPVTCGTAFRFRCPARSAGI